MSETSQSERIGTDARQISASRTDFIGILCVMGAVTAFSINDTLIKLLSGDYPLHEITFIRGAISGLFALFVFVPLEGGFGNLRTPRWRLHLLRGMTVVVANMTFFAGLAALPLGEATAIFFVGPLFITALSYFFLGERIGPRRWFAVTIGLVGVIVMIRPGMATFQAAAILPALAAFCYASLQIMTRKLGMAEKASTMTFYINLSFVVFSGAFGLAFGDGRYAGWDSASMEFLTRAWIWPSARDWLLLGVVGIIISLAAYLVSQAYRSCEAGLLAPFEYVAMPLAVVLGIVIWGDWPDAVAWLGILLIAGGGLFVFIRETLLGNAGRWKKPLPRSR